MEAGVYMLLSGALPSTTPCGNSIIYPIAMDILNIQDKKSIVFMLYCDESEIAYIVKPRSRNGHRSGLDYVKSGDPLTISQAYEDLPWPEHIHKDKNGYIVYKVAPSDEERDHYLKQRS